jgi:hypothetical protein
MSKAGEGLARLADIAAAVCRQQDQKAPAVPSPPPREMLPVAAARANQLVPIAPPTTVQSALKRSTEFHDAEVERQPSAKKKRKGGPPDASDDIRFREYQAEIWTEKFEDLCEFRRRHGHCHVPHTYQDNSPLAQWVKRQRYQYKLKLEGKRSTLTDERVKILDQIGFIWNSHDAVWEERWNELLHYQQIQKDCIVPSNYQQNPQLAVWVKRQRRQYKFYCEGKPTSMTPERITKLERLGFAWDCRKPKGSEENPRIMGAAISPHAQLPRTVQIQANPAALVRNLPCDFFSFSRQF